MGRKISPKGEAFQPDLTPAGNHRACIVAMIELGTHTVQYQGKPPKESEQIYVVYELLDLDEEATADGRDGPYIVARQYTLSLYEGAGFSKVVSAALGRPLGKDEEVDLDLCVGKAVMIGVSHRPSKKGDVSYDDVGDATPVASVLRKMPVRPKYVPFYAELGTYRDHDWVPWLYGKKASQKIVESAEVRSGRVKPPDQPVVAAGQQPAAAQGGDIY